MQPHTASVNVSEELSRLGEKRQVLEQLLSFAHQLTHLQGSIEAVQQMLKPSQLPGKKTSAIAEYCKKAEAQDTPGLLALLSTLDKAIASDFKLILALSTLGTEAFIAQYAKSNKDIDTLAASKAKMLDFRRKGEMNVAIRYVLYERGVQQGAARLPISQNDVAERLETVRGEERQCRGRLKRDMEGMVADIKAIMAQAGCPDQLRQRMSIVRDQLERSLTMLAQNRSLEDLPATVEVIELSSDESSADSSVAEVASAPVPQAPTESVALPPRSFWEKLRLWLNSPWSVRWRDLDKHD